MKLGEEQRRSVVAPNPPSRGRILSTRVRELHYEHVAEPERGHVIRVHKFGRGVRLYCNPDGSLTLTHSGGKPLWTDDGA